MNHRKLLTLAAILLTSLAVLNAQDKPAKSKIDSIVSNYEVFRLQRELNGNNISFRSIDVDSLTSETPDSVYIERLKEMDRAINKENFKFVPIEFNKQIKNCIIRYTEKYKKSTAKIIRLEKYYGPQIEAIFIKDSLPKELKAMAMIESAFNPRAVSPAKATGMWQFMYVTARQYGLTINSYVDERMDPVKSCEAAAKYLKDSYRIFEDWSLAIASYNCGPGNVLKAIKRSGKTDFWEIYDYLPAETRGYIPAFIAALYVLEYYDEHNIPVSAATATLPPVDTFHIRQDLYFKRITENIDIPIDLLRDLNPQFIRDMVPGARNTGKGDSVYVFTLPISYTAEFASKEKDIYRKDTTATKDVDAAKTGAAVDGKNGIQHTFAEGETLASIAIKYHTTVVNIKKWNNLGENPPTPGQVLTIMTTPEPKVPSNNNTPSNIKTQSNGKPSSGYVMYTVRKGDSLSAIARKHGMTLTHLCKLNGLKTSSKIYPGMKIRIR